MNGFHLFFPSVMFNLLSLPSLVRDIDKIDDLMQDVTEQQDTAREISEAISRPFGETFDEVHTFPTSSVKISFNGIHYLSSVTAISF